MAEADGGPVPLTRMNVVLNWASELDRRVQ